MKINFENYLHKLDVALKNKTKTELYLTYIFIFLVIFAFSYLFFWDNSFNTFKKTRENIVNIQNNINNDNLYLQKNPRYKITQLDKEIKQINKKIIQLKDTNTYIKNRIETISSLIYNEKSWGEYLNSISTNAQKNHIRLLNLTNKYSKIENTFGHMLDISIKVDGNFKNTLKFINRLEQSNLVVDLHDFNIDANSSLKSDLNISVWGIAY